MKFSHSLMHDNFTKSDMSAAINLLKKRKRRYLNNDDGLNALEFKESNKFDEFYTILQKSKEKFQKTF